MKNITPGIHCLKERIRIKAPLEVCYQAWIDSSYVAEVMRRVFKVQDGPGQPRTGVAITSVEELQSKVPLLNQDMIPAIAIKHWILSGPGGKLYEIENTVVLEIPNHFYCTTSVDPEDLSTQSSVSFSSDARNLETLLEWQISFWASINGGKSTQLGSDILESGDHFMEECLRDFKASLEIK